MRSNWLYFADPVRTTGSAELDLPTTQGDCEVGDEGVLGLA